MTDLNLGPIGNCSTAALIDRRARIIWWCLPRFDGDPVFCKLLNGTDQGDARGAFEIAVDRYARSEQEYIENTAILVTRLFDDQGGAVEITDFAPRFEQLGRVFRPLMIYRIVRRVAGTPRIRVRLHPTSGYGAADPEITHGSNHIRYVGETATIRLTTDAPPSYILEEMTFFLDEPLSFVLGPDEPLSRSPASATSEFFDRTRDYWRDWIRQQALPLEWQDAVIRAAITIKLCSFEETGAIIAAMTTSIPESADSGRNWDYRYCWLRDAFFVVRALNRLGAVRILENYLRYLSNIMALADGGHIQPVYGIALEEQLTEREITSLEGYRGMGPVRVGNQAYEQIQHDVYGDIVLASTQAFFDKRLFRQAGPEDFKRLEAVGERAYKLHNRPDASMWEQRGNVRVHTSSSLMCWAACDRLAKIAEHLSLQRRAGYWSRRAEKIRDAIEGEAWNPEIDSFADYFGGDRLDASLMLMHEVGFLQPGDSRFEKTLAAVEKRLLRGPHLMRYHAADDFGAPTNSFIICSFWYVEALVALGRRDEARDIFEGLLAKRNHLGLLSEDLEIDSGELWGNFPQTYSLVGLINCALRLSRTWESVL